MRSQAAKDERTARNAQPKLHHAPNGFDMARDFPVAFLELAIALQTSAPKKGRPYTAVLTAHGWTGDDWEAERELMARGIPPGELTDRQGHSRRPHFTQAKNQ